MAQLDLQIVRDFARRAILTSAEDVDYVGIAEQFSDDENWPTDEDAAERMHEAIDAEVGRAIVTVSWPDEQPTAEQDDDVRAVADLPAMGEKYLDRLAGLADLPCSCGVVDCEIYGSALTRDQARELVAEARRARAALDARDAKGGE